MKTYTEIHVRKNGHGFEGEFNIILTQDEKGEVVKEFKFVIDDYPGESELIYFHVRYKGYAEDFFSCSAPRIFNKCEINEETLKELRKLGLAKQAVFFVFMESVNAVMEIFTNFQKPELILLNSANFNSTSPWFVNDTESLVYELPMPKVIPTCVRKKQFFPNLEKDFAQELLRLL